MSNLRYELKLVCEGQQLAQVRSWIRLHPAAFIIAFPPRQVNNIYLDTPALDSLNANLIGVSKRCKLRLRWYDKEIQPWLELKSKENLLGDKKRAPLPCSIDLNTPWVEILQAVRDCAPSEWRPWLYGLIRPSLYNRYQREYYVTPDGAIRATIDTEQYACDQRFCARPNLRRSLPIRDTVIIEIKGVPDEIDRLQDVVGRFPISRGRNSKYVNSMLAALFTQ